MASMTGTDVVTYSRERLGMSAFMLEDGVVYHACTSVRSLSSRLGDNSGYED
jgi:hypothetical protein